MACEALDYPVMDYLSALLYQSSCFLNSSHTDLLAVSSICHSSSYLMAFAHAAPFAWNSLLPDSLMAHFLTLFKPLLKCHHPSSNSTYTSTPVSNCITLLSLLVPDLLLYWFIDRACNVSLMGQSPCVSRSHSQGPEECLENSNCSTDTCWMKKCVIIILVIT